MRSVAASARAYFSQYYRGARTTQEWNDLWSIAQSVDSTLELAYQSGGYMAVCSALDNDDRLEHWLSRIGAEISFQISGDVAMKRELQSALAPGNDHILPSWAVSAARDLTKQVYLQQGRLRSSPASPQQDEDAQQGGGLRRRPRKPKAKGKADGKPSSQ